MFIQGKVKRTKATSPSTGARGNPATDTKHLQQHKAEQALSELHSPFPCNYNGHLGRSVGTITPPHTPKEEWHPHTHYLLGSLQSTVIPDLGQWPEALHISGDPREDITSHNFFNNLPGLPYINNRGHGHQKGSWWPPTL